MSSWKPVEQASASRNLLLLAGIVAIVAILGISGWRIHTEYLETLEDDRLARHARAKTADVQISNALRSLDRLLRTVEADWQSAGGENTKNFRQHIENYRRIHGPDIRHITLIDGDGIIRASTVTAVIGGSAHDKPHFLYHSAPGAEAFHLSAPYAAANKALVMAASRAVRDAQGNFRGVVHVTVSPKFFEDILAGISVGNGDAINFNDSDRIILTRVPDNEKHAGKSVARAAAQLFHERLRQPLSDSRFPSAADGTDRLFTIRDLAFPPGYRVTVTSDAETVMTPWRTQAVTEGVIALMAALLVLILMIVSHRETRAITVAEQRYRTLFEQMIGGFALHEIICDESGKPVDYRFLSVNPAFEKLTGIAAAQIVGKRLLEVMPNSEPAWIERYGKVALTGEPAEFNDFSREIGRYFEVRAFRPAPGQFAVMFSDITPREESLAAIRASEDKFSRAFQFAPMLMSISLLENGCFLDVNRRFCEVSGFKREEVIGHTSAEIGWLRAADRECLVARIKEHGRIDGMELTFHAKDGREVVVWYCGELIEVDGQMSLLSIADDITDKKRVECELELHRQHLEELVLQRTGQYAIALSQAETACRAKSVFLANMSHELKTPLNAVLGFSQMLARDGSLDGEQRRNAEIVNRSGRQLLELIDDILDISRIEAGRIGVHADAFDLGALLQDLADTFGQRAREKGLSLQFERQPDLPFRVTADVDKLRKVLTNLLGNAIKFTRSGSVSLRVGTHTEVGRLLLDVAVTDTGGGIAPEEQLLLFKPFSQTPDGERRGEGIGLGLAICHSYVDMLGGNLEIDSALGRGSSFSFSIPLEAAEAPQPAPALRDTALVNLRVLIIDDDDDLRLLGARLLRKAGFDVREAVGGREGIEIFGEWQPQLVLMDMRMPGIDGFEATRSIRSRPDGGSVLIFALTASAFTEERNAIFAAGCNEVLLKPLEEAALFDLIGRHIELSAGGLQQSASASASSGGPSAAMDFSLMPQELRERLRLVAIELDGQGVREIADEIEPEQPELAASLRHCADQYRLDLLLDQLQ